MGISCRMFLFDQNDHLFRLANTKFARMLEDPARHRLPGFSGQRVRAAEALVELHDREPTHILQVTFVIFSFNDEGCFDSQKFCKQQPALAELAIEPVMFVPDCKANIVAAASKFIAQGSRWTPSKALAQIVHDAAMERIRCPRA